MQENTPLENNNINEIENNSHSPTNSDTAYEFNSYYSPQFVFDSIFNCGVYDYFSKEEIDAVLRNAIANHDAAV